MRSVPSVASVSPGIGLGPVRDNAGGRRGDGKQVMNRRIMTVLSGVAVVVALLLAGSVAGAEDQTRDARPVVADDAASAEPAAESVASVDLVDAHADDALPAARIAAVLVGAGAVALLAARRRRRPMRSRP